MITFLIIIKTQTLEKNVYHGHIHSPTHLPTYHPSILPPFLSKAIKGQQKNKRMEGGQK